jgi:hypothetical protein
MFATCLPGCLAVWLSALSVTPLIYDCKPLSLYRPPSRPPTKLKAPGEPLGWQAGSRQAGRQAGRQAAAPIRQDLSQRHKHVIEYIHASMHPCIHASMHPCIHIYISMHPCSVWCERRTARKPRLGCAGLRQAGSAVAGRAEANNAMAVLWAMLWTMGHG